MHRYLFTALFLAASCSGRPSELDGSTPSDDAAVSPVDGSRDASGPPLTDTLTGPLTCTPACPKGSVCSNGSCKVLPESCPCPIESYCDLSTNTCKPGCTKDSECSAGKWCDTIQRVCNAGCRVDAECGAPQHATAHCQSHGCTFTCLAGFHRCSNVCADNSSVNSCGASCMPCPTRANASATCDGSQCGFSCNSGFVDCNNDPGDGCEHAVTPVLCYQDADGDGFGDKSVTKTFDCGSCPVGWTSKNDVFDCYDQNKDVFPGQTKMFCTPYNGSSFDYDCNGTITKQEGQYSKYSSGPCYIEFPSSMACGETRQLYICAPGNVESFTRCCR